MIAKSLTTAALLAFSGLAMAHAGHGPHHDGLVSGLLHPLLGVDHLLALLAIGAWSAWQAPMGRHLVPLTGITGLVAGAAVGLAGFPVSGIEAGIVFTVVLAGGLMASRVRLPAGGGGLLAGLFMAVHGVAHGVEMHAGTDAAGYLIGLTVASLAMMFVGRAVGGVLARSDRPATARAS